MLYRKLGKNGPEVSALGFGSMRLPMTAIGEEQFVDLDKAVEVMQHAFDVGVNYIDSGFMYCNKQSEIAVGRALRGYRDKIVVTTKASKMRVSNPGDLPRMLDHQLDRMELDYFDYYCFHGVGFESLHEVDKKTGWISDAVKAKEQGLVKRLAFSFHSEPESMVKLVDMGLFEMVTCQYNYLDRRNAESMAHAAEKGLGIVVMGPVGGGKLANLPGFIRKADGLDASNAAQLAIRFVLANPGVQVALSGMGTMEMVEQNAKAVEAGPLTDAEYAQINGLLEKTKKLADLYCTACGYCQPCDQGVNIPGRFEAMNYLKVYGLEDLARTTYTRVRANEAKTEGRGVCTACKKCEEQCPQNIPIIQQLQETEAALGQAAPQP